MISCTIGDFLIGLGFWSQWICYKFVCSTKLHIKWRPRWQAYKIWFVFYKLLYCLNVFFNLFTISGELEKSRRGHFANRLQHSLVKREQTSWRDSYPSSPLIIHGLLHNVILRIAIAIDHLLLYLKYMNALYIYDSSVQGNKSKTHNF